MRNRTLIWLLLGGGAFVLLIVMLLAVILTFNGDGRTDFAFSGQIQVVEVEVDWLQDRRIQGHWFGNARVDGQREKVFSGLDRRHVRTICRGGRYRPQAGVAGGPITR